MTPFDETFDWVVVGSGAGSMASALLMRQAGKSVVLLEAGADPEAFAFDADAAVHDAGYTVESADVTTAAAAGADAGESCCGGGGCC